MTNLIRRSITALSLFGFAACGQADATPNADLERDLEQTRLAEFEMANQNAKKIDVVSARERIPTGTRVPARRAPVPPTNPQTTVTADAETATSPIDTTLTAPRPRSTPQTQQRRGPYKTVGEIIRNAPFPINP